MTTDKAEELLAEVKLRRTRQRVDILTALINAKAPVNQAQIMESLGKSSPNKVTIYRVLESLIETGIVHQAYIQDRCAYYELGHNCTAQQCHPHFTCISCKETRCMKDVELPMAKSSDGFVIKHQQVRLEGLCPNCSQAVEGSTGNQAGTTNG